MIRRLSLAAAALLAAAQSGATPPVPPDTVPPGIPPDYDPPPPNGLIFTPLPGPYGGRRPVGDILGDVWEMGEVASWTAVWLRRGRTEIFDGYWTNPNGERVRATLQIWANGRRVTALRRHPDGQSCRYEGRIAPDWVQVQGQYPCSWERTPMPWHAQIVRMEEVTPAILRYWE